MYTKRSKISCIAKSVTNITGGGLIMIILEILFLA